MFFSYQQTVALGELSPEQFLMLAAVSMDDLGWDHYTPDESHLYARAHMGVLSWGELVSVTIIEQQAVLSSRQPMWKFLAPRRSEKNVLSLMEYMDHNRKIHTAESLQQLQEEQLENRTQRMQPTEKIIMAPDVPIATAIIIGLTTLCFIVIGLIRGNFSPISVMELFHWGGNIRLHTLGGEGWRLISSCFLHINSWHLFGNMFTLLFIGRLLEPVIGPYKLATSYLCTGVIGSLVSVMVAGNRISAGASGAVFGLFGVFLAILTTGLLTGETKRVLFKGVFLLIAYGLYEGMFGSVDNAAHVGGLLSGVAFGYMIYAFYGSLSRSIAAMSFVVLITAGATAYILKHYHTDTVVYERMLNRMHLLETRARNTKKNIETIAPSQQLYILQRKIEPIWKEFTAIADSAKGFNFGNNNTYPLQQGLLYRYGLLKQQETELAIRSLERGIDLSDKKDRIKMLLKQNSDSLGSVYARSIMKSSGE
jgi:rhomboid protease GluP